MSVKIENNFALGLAICGRGRCYVCLTIDSFFHLWARQCNCRVLLQRAGATPRTFWAAESRKSGVAPARFGSFPAAAFWVSFQASHCLPAACAVTRVKTRVQEDLQSDDITFFTASRSCGISGEPCSFGFGATDSR